jgi:hypothetical protein
MVVFRFNVNGSLDNDRDNNGFPDSTPGDSFGNGDGSADAKVTLTFPNTFTTASNANSVMEAAFTPFELLIGGYRTYDFSGPGGAQCTGCDFAVVALRETDGELNTGFGESSAGYTFTNFCLAFYAPINGCCGTGYASQESAYDLLCWEEAPTIWHIIAVGSTNYTDRQSTQFAAVRYDKTGHRETTWGPNQNGAIAVGSGAAGPASNAIAYDGENIETRDEGDGDFYAAGVGIPGTTNKDFVAARWNEDGTIDTGFGTGGQVKLDLGTPTTAYYDTARGIKIMPIGLGGNRMISVGGYTGTTSNAGRIGVAQFLPDNRVTVNAPGGPGAPMAVFVPEGPTTASDQPPGPTALLLGGGNPDDDLLSSA